MKKFILMVIILMAPVAIGKSLTSVSQVDGNALNSMQHAWKIVESENSADTQTNALSEVERTKKIVDALIAANANEEAQISIFPIPSTWNGVRFRSIIITDAGTQTHQIYLGTLGGGLDCELTHAGELAWVAGTQRSTYSQIAFTLGGADGAGYVPQPGDTITGNTSDETAVIVSIAETASTWSAGTAAGTVTYRSASGTFTNSETVSISRAGNIIASNAYKHAASDVIHFEMADTLTATAKSWGSTWTTTSPADNTNAEAEIDVKGADYMVTVTTTASVDGKLIARGY